MGNCKNPMKNKWFLVCFRREKSLKTNTESEKNILHQRTSIALATDQKKSDPCPDDVNDSRKLPRRRRFCRVFDRVFSNAASALYKRKRNKGSGKEASSNHHNNVSSKFQKIFNTSSEKKSKSLLSAPESLSLLSSHSSIFSSSTWDSSLRSSLSSSSFSPRNSSRRKQTPCMDKTSTIPGQKMKKEKEKEEEEEKNGNCSSNKMGIGLYAMVIISLIGLIFWGEAFAIVCTSMCLFLFSFIHGGISLKENGGDDSIDNECKRKVVTVGNT